MAEFKLTEKLTPVWDQLVSRIESNPGVWEKPWFMSKDGSGSIVRPMNFSTGRKYSGFNIFNLEVSRLTNGFSSSKWLTFKQCSAMNGYIKKGSKGSFIITYSPPKFGEEEKNGEMKKVMIRPPYFGSGYVFNLDQTTLEDVTPETPAPETPERPGLMTVEAVEALIKCTGAKIREIPSDKAYYSPGLDEIVLPQINQFKSLEGYYGTKYHELIHWTGHTSRLNRLKVNASFGSESYSREELTAEIGSVFLKCETGINDGVDNAAAYIRSWWNNVKEDKGSLIEACGKAQKASDYILKCKEA